MKNNTLAPIILFVYNRPWHTKQTLEALAKNELAKESVLYIYADGAKESATETELQKINEVREVISSFEGCKEMHIIVREKNWGLADNIIDGVTKIVNQYGKIIVLEDDIVTSVGFLKYMNDALDFYQDEEKIMHISGYMFPVKANLPSTFFYNTASCWGWATWAESWSNFNSNTQELVDEIGKRNLIEKFNIENSYNFYGDLRANTTGQIKTWAVRWYASLFLQEGHCLHPFPSLVQNIGFDGAGENCDVSNKFYWEELADYIVVEPIKIIENEDALKAMKVFNTPNNTTENDSLSALKYNLFQFLPKKLQHKYSYKRDKVYRNDYDKRQEIDRIKKLERYQEGETKVLFENLISFVDSASFLFIYDEIFDKEIYKFKTNKTEPYIIDAGANIGLSVIYFKQLYPNAKVVAFEPDKKVARVLEKNINSLALKNIELIKKGLWNEETTLRFYAEGADGGRLAEDQENQNVIEIETIRLREFLQEPVDMLKIDIEGAETKVIEDCQDLLHNVEHLFVEYHSFINQEQELGKLIRILENAKFKLYITSPGITSPRPFVKKDTYLGMDMQLNIYAKKP